MKHLEKMLSAWMKDHNQRHVPVSLLLVQSKAYPINEDLSKADDNVKPFRASTGWFSRLTKRYIS